MKETLKELLYVGAFAVATLGLTQGVSSCVTEDLKKDHIYTQSTIDKLTHELDSLNAVTAKLNYEKARLKFEEDNKYNRKDYSSGSIILEDFNLMKK